MKTTTCVRVVLPTDELVRVECATTMTIADLVRVMEKRCLPYKNSRVETKDERFSSVDNNWDAEAASEANRAWHLRGDTSGVPHGKLILVRMESELKAGSLITEDVKQLDILEFQFVGPSCPTWTAEADCLQTRKASQTSNGSSRKAVEEIRPVSTALTPLLQSGRDYPAEGPPTRPTECSDCAEAALSLLSPVARRQSGVRLKGLVRRSKSRHVALWQRRVARSYRTWSHVRARSVDLPSISRQERIKHADHHNSEYALLHAGMQLIERIQLLQGDLQGLVLLVRDAILGRTSLAADAFLPFLSRMVDTLMHPNTVSGATSMAGLSTSKASGTIGAVGIIPAPIRGEKEALIRTLSRSISCSDGGVATLLQGWVVSAAWGTFWRKQRREYACLCDNHMLYFFSSQSQCEDFVFELGRERDSGTLETSKRSMKENSPLNQIDLSETDWTVRKMGPQSDGSDEQHRFAFAFFDGSGKMQLVLDVTTAAEASTWARAIAVEIKRNRLLSKMRELNSMSTDSQWEGNVEEKQHPGNWMQIMTQSAAIPGKQNALEIPLRSLYARIDRLDENARAERYRSWTLTQALKDLQRDRVQINGEMRPGVSLEANIIALMLEILRSTLEREDRAVAGRLGEIVAAPSSSPSAEMAALCFARQLIMCSSRTHGGGDILDTLHLLFGTDRFCICPDAQAMEPIEIVLSRSSNIPATLSARITMKMTYRVIPTESVAPTGVQNTSRDCYGERKSVGSSRPTERSGEHEQTEYKIIGTYTQKLTYGSVESNEVNGSVQVEFADLGRAKLEVNGSASASERTS